MAAFKNMFTLIVVIMGFLTIASAGDPDMLQDICVADLTSSKLILDSSISFICT